MNWTRKEKKEGKKLSKKQSIILLMVCIMFCLVVLGLSFWQFNVVVNWNNRLNLYKEVWNINPHASDDFELSNVQANGSDFIIQYDINNTAGVDNVKLVLYGSNTYTLSNLSADEKYAHFSGIADGTYMATAYAYSTKGNLIKTSNSRLIKTGEVEGAVVSYLNPDDDTFDYSGQYLCSPSIARLDDGTLFISHDLYNSGVANQNLTRIYRSIDDGETWEFISDLYPCYWGKLFVIDNTLYMIACSTEYGDLLIGSSSDGINWSNPTMILKGGNHITGGVHKAPNPVLISNGRVYCAIEYGSWINGHDSGYVCASVDCDLLNAENWTVSNFLKYSNKNVSGALSGKGLSYLEGNILENRNGELVNILRYNTKDSNEPYGKAVMMHIDRENNKVVSGETINFIGNMAKFAIMYDSNTDRYLSLVNKVTNGNPSQRNVLTLVDSYDLYNWNDDGDIINYEDNGYPEDDTKVGFQYIDWIIVGNDIYFVSRTAINGADSYHNSNYVTFHKIENYQDLIR